MERGDEVLTGPGSSPVLTHLTLVLDHHKAALVSVVELLISQHVDFNVGDGGWRGARRRWLAPRRQKMLRVCILGVGFDVPGMRGRAWRSKGGRALKGAEGSSGVESGLSWVG